MKKGRLWLALVAAGLVLVTIVTGLALVLVLPWHLRTRWNVREMERIIADLRSNDATVREAAAGRLSAMAERGLTVDAGLVALEGAAGEFPAGPDEDDGGTLLVDAVAKHAAEAHVPVVRREFTRYSTGARFSALLLLANLGDAGVEPILAILQDHTAECEEVDLQLALEPMIPEGGKALFPEILRYLENERLGIPVAHLTFSMLTEGDLPSASLAPYAESLLKLYGARRGLLVARQRGEGHRWMWEESYLEPRGDAGLLLDLFGYAPSDATRRELARAVTEYTDPKLLTFAAVALVRQGERVAPGVLERVASSAEMRNTLHDQLAGLGRAALFPSRYRTQAAFAESDMVNWLVYPTELAQVPDEIELMKIVTAGPAGEEEDYYVYRFRMHEPHWAADDGWMAGVAGAFARRDQPTTESQGHTFSSFAAWDSKTPEEHVGEVTKALGEAWEHKAKEARFDATP